MDTLDDGDESGVANDPGYGGNARRMRPSERVMNALAAADRETYYATVNYASLAATLSKNGWRKQQHEWRMVTLDDEPQLMTGDAAEQSIEWWNRGPDFVFVHRMGEAAIVCSPAKTRRALASRLVRHDT